MVFYKMVVFGLIFFLIFTNFYERLILLLRAKRESSRGTQENFFLSHILFHES